MKFIIINYKKLAEKIFLVACVLFALVVMGIKGNTSTVFNEVSIRLPIIMYHHISTNSKQWNPYVISPNEFEEDIIYLKSLGYNTIDTENLLKYVYEGEPLPEKPIMITLDDGYLSGYEYALPILKKHSVKAIISIIGVTTNEYTENKETDIRYAYLNWERVKALIDTPYVEIQNHSYDAHRVGGRKGYSSLPGESSNVYREFFKSDVARMQALIKEKTGYTPTALAYPFGAYEKKSKDMLKELGIKVAYTCNEKVNILSGDIEELYYLGRFNRASGINRVEFFKKMEP